MAWASTFAASSGRCFCRRHSETNSTMSWRYCGYFRSQASSVSAVTSPSAAKSSSSTDSSALLVAIVISPCFVFHGRANFREPSPNPPAGLAVQRRNRHGVQPIALDRDVIEVMLNKRLLNPTRKFRELTRHYVRQALTELPLAQLALRIFAGCRLVCGQMVLLESDRSFLLANALSHEVNRPLHDFEAELRLEEVRDRRASIAHGAQDALINTTHHVRAFRVAEPLAIGKDDRQCFRKEHALEQRAQKLRVGRLLQVLCQMHDGFRAQGRGQVQPGRTGASARLR